MDLGSINNGWNNYDCFVYCKYVNWVIGLYVYIKYVIWVIGLLGKSNLVLWYVNSINIFIKYNYICLLLPLTLIGNLVINW